MTPSLLTAKEVRARLRLGRSGPYELAKRREVDTVRIGDRLLFVEASVDALVQRNTVRAKREFFATHRR